MSNETIERIAKRIAEGLGDDFDHAFASKSDWNANRGERGGRYRDVNEPMQGDYLGAARATIAEMLKLEPVAWKMPTEAGVVWSHPDCPPPREAILLYDLSPLKEALRYDQP